MHTVSQDASGQTFGPSRTDATGLQRWMEPVICNVQAAILPHTPAAVCCTPFLLKYLFPERGMPSLNYWLLSPPATTSFERDSVPAKPRSGVCLGLSLSVFSALFDYKVPSNYCRKEAGERKQPEPA